MPHETKRSESASTTALNGITATAATKSDAEILLVTDDTQVPSLWAAKLEVYSIGPRLFGSWRVCIYLPQSCKITGVT